MITLYNAIAGSCAEDKANAGGGTPAPPSISMALVNLGPTLGGPTGGSFNTGGVQLIPNGGGIASNTGHTLQVGYTIASPSGAAITTARLTDNFPGVGGTACINQLFNQILVRGTYADVNPWQDDPDYSTFGASAQDVVLGTGATHHQQIDILQTLAIGNVPNILYMQFYETASAAGMTSSLSPPNLTAGDPLELELHVTDANGNTSTVVSAITLA